MFTVYLIKVVWVFGVEALAFAQALIKCCWVFIETFMKKPFVCSEVKKKKNFLCSTKSYFIFKFGPTVNSLRKTRA